MKKLIGIAIFFQFLVGCATDIFIVDVPSIEESESVDMIDLRPRYESEGESFSREVFNNGYGIYRLKDEIIDPSRLRLFQHRVYEKFSARNEYVVLIVHHFISYSNFQSARKSDSVGSIFGVIGSAAAHLMHNNDFDFSYSEIVRGEFEVTTGRYETARAQYSEAENPNEASVFITYIDAEINGKRKIIRSIAPTNSENDIEPYVNALENTINAFLVGY